MSVRHPDGGSTREDDPDALIARLVEVRGRIEQLADLAGEDPDGASDDAHRQRVVRERLRVSEAEQQRLAQRLRLVLGGLSEALLRLDDDLRVVSVNAAAEELVGWSEAQALGRPLSLGDEVSDRNLHARLRVIKAEGHAVRFRTGLEHDRVRFDVRARPTSPGLTLRLRDVTSQEAEQERLKLLDIALGRLHDIVLITEAEPLDDPGPRIVFVNDAFERLTGYRREEVIGRSPRLLQGPRTQREELDRIRRALDRWQPVRAQLINYTRAGEVLWLELDIVPLADESGWYTHWVAVERDITEQKRAQLALEHSNRALRLLSRCSEALIHAPDEGQLFDTVCRLAVDVGGYRMAWAGFARDDDARSIEPVAVAGVDNGYLAASRFSWSEDVPEGWGPAGRAVRSGRPAFVGNLEADARFGPWREQASARGYASVVCLPLNDEQRAFGVLVLYKGDGGPVSREERQLLQELADDLAYGVTTRRLQRREARLQHAVLHIASAVSARSGVDFLDRLAERMTEALDADAGYIARLSADGDRAYTVSRFEDGARRENLEYDLLGTPCAAYEAAPTCVIPDDVAERYADDLMLREFGARAYVGQRLGDSTGRPLGMLFVLFRAPLEDTEFALAVLRIFAAGAAAELEREHADTRLRQQAMLLEKTRDAIFLTDIDGRILYWNRGAEQTYGWSSAEALGQRCRELLQTDDGQYNHAIESVLMDGYWQGELIKSTRSGSALIVDAHWTLSTDGPDNQQRILHLGTDITERKQDEARIQQLAFYDAATGLPNRALFMDRLEQALAASRRTDSPVAVLFLDLNHFKEINDTQGHAMGDRVLMEVARRFKGSLRAGETLARLGGDEFVVMAVDADQAAGERIAERLHRHLETPLEVVGHSFSLDVSIGIASFPDDGDSADTLLKHTDIAMYRAKREGRPHCRYQARMSTDFERRLALYLRFAEALKSEALTVHYQPQVDLARGRLVGAEALLRWHDPEWGWVSPSRFIPMAEERRLMDQVGRWVIRRVCRTIAEWQAAGLFLPGPISINVSSQQLETMAFVDMLTGEIEAAGLDPRVIGLELTETGMMHDPEQAVAVCGALRDAGFTLSIDDFGTGYSSLGYLKRFPIARLKMDLSFVRDMLVDDNDYAIVRTIISMAEGLGLTTLAEGVESTAQADALLALGCEQAQGFLYGHPEPAEVFAGLWLTS